MKKSLTILCDDSYDQKHVYQPDKSKNERESVSPYSKTNKNFTFLNSTTCQTPQSKQNLIDIYQFKSPKYVGIIEKNVLQRLKYYEQKHKDKLKIQHMSTKVKEQQLAIRQLKQKPQINQTSKQLFEKVKKQRKLSPNILERFQTYECEKASRSAKYDFMKAQGLNIQNSTFTCRKNIKDNVKSRSPLNQRSMNQKRSKSKSASNLQKIVKNPSNIGRIVQRKQPSCYQTKKRQDINKYCEKQIFYSLMPKQSQMKEQLMVQQNPLPENRKNPIKRKYQTDANDSRQLSPIFMKKNETNTKKWKVIV